MRSRLSEGGSAEPLPAIAMTAAAVVLFFVFFPLELASPQREAPESIIIKGSNSPALFIFRKSNNKEERLINGAKIQSGDIIQLQYAARGAAHGVILSVDGRGTVTLHFPSNVNGSTELKKGAAYALGFSYELDDAPEFERFFFVTSPSPIKAEVVLEIARELGGRRTGKLDLPNGMSQTDFLLKKRNSNP